MLFFGMICATMLGVSAQRCGDRRQMNCKQDCPTTNGQLWRTYKTTNHGCCHGWSCGGHMKHCIFDCKQSAQCSSSDCDGDWKLKSSATSCEGSTCPKNTGKCCTYQGSSLAPEYTIEVVKSGDCESNGFEFIKNKEECMVAGRLLGESDEQFLNNPYSGGALQKYCGTFNNVQLSFNSKATGSLPWPMVSWWNIMLPILQEAGSPPGYFQICKSKTSGYCQPDLATIAADLAADWHISDPHMADNLAIDYLVEPLDDACDEANGGVDCSQLPPSCRDGGELQAQWVYSKWYIEKCSGDHGNNQCRCEFPTRVWDKTLPTASLQLVDENPGINMCTYGLPGSYGYDKIPNDHKNGRRRTPEETAESDLSARLVTLEEETANI